ncbi:hypothetical protein GCM10022393_09710 [Aquimarina addita]|uniref:Thioredoxin domain-containing protein n=1 Tax=Aquimarina addita TaxID=870485 RepID=A0ABP7XCQ7_9FLAO
MKKVSFLIMMIVLSASTFVSCKNNPEASKEKVDESSSVAGEHPERKGPPPGGDRKGPPSGDRAQQTKTLEEIGGYKIGDVATDFSLKNVDGSMVSLASVENAKGYIVTFTCNECPFAKMYEDRLIALHTTYAPKGYAVIAINPNVSVGGKESFEAMVTRAEEKSFPFPYLADEKQEIYPQYGAVRTPHIFLLDKERKVQYIGTIDDNAKSPEDVKVKYLENAIEALEKGEKPNPDFTKAIGCPIKAKKA